MNQNFISISLYILKKKILNQERHTSIIFMNTNMLQWRGAVFGASQTQPRLGLTMCQAPGVLGSNFKMKSHPQLYWKSNIPRHKEVFSYPGCNVPSMKQIVDQFDQRIQIVANFIITPINRMTRSFGNPDPYTNLYNS